MLSIRIEGLEKDLIFKQQSSLPTTATFALIIEHVACGLNETVVLHMLDSLTIVIYCLLIKIDHVYQKDFHYGNVPQESYIPHNVISVFAKADRHHSCYCSHAGVGSSSRDLWIPLVNYIATVKNK